MALITGSSTIDWSTISLGQVDFAAAIAQVSNRSNQIGSEFGSGQFTIDFFSRTLFAVELNSGGLLSLGGLFPPAPLVLRSFDFLDPATGEVVRYTGVFNGGATETITSATIGSPDFLQTINGNITVFPNDTFSGTVSSLVAKIGAATVTVSGAMRISGNSSTANLTGTVTGISVVSGTDTISMTGISLPIDTLEAAIANLTVANVEDLFSVVGALQAGNDTIVYTNDSGAAMAFSGGAGDDTITIDGANGDTLDGGTGNDALAGGLGQDTVSGGAGHDQITMLVTAGDADTIDAGVDADTLVLSGVVPGNDEVVVDLSSGIDQVTSIGGVADVLAQINFEHLDASGIGSFVTVTGSSGDNVIVGSTGDDIIDSGDGNDVLNGGAGDDAMDGGAGNDIFLVDSSGDIVTEAPGGGTDLVRSAAAEFTLGADVEHLTLLGSADINGIGNGLSNILTGNSGNNELVGGGGDDQLVGGAGHDDLNGGAGNDVMIGAVGNDIYAVDSLSDVVTEAFNAGTDTVFASLNYTLGANVENLTLTGGALTGTGNALNNILTDTSAVNTLAGGAGHDTYVVQNEADVVIEGANAGIDLVQSTAANFTLGANVEHLTLAGVGDFNGTGNQLGNTLIGNSGVNILMGLAGNDMLSGGAGDDTVQGGDGNDVILIGNDADHGVGEVIDGGAGTDILRFTSTTDDQTLVLMAGVTGIEAVVIANAAGLATGTTDLNVDASLVTSGLLMTGNAGDNELTGTGFNDILNGGAGDDTLDGGAGTNLLIGGRGDDTFVVATATDLVSEGLNGGLDTVEAALSYTLGANVENLELTGNLAINGTGNALNNSLTGNDGANVLTGGAGNDLLEGEDGADTVLGGIGNDRIVMDVVVGHVDTADGGIGLDTLALVGTVNGDGVAVVDLNSVLDQVTDIGTVDSETLVQRNFENLDASGLDGTVTATGSAGANVMIGSDGVDVLAGLAGNDILNGGAGDDTLDSGDGNDIILIADQGDHAGGEVVAGGTGTDVVRFTNTTDGQTLVLTNGVTGIEAVVIGTAAGVTTGTTALNVDASAVTGTGLLIVGNAGDNLLTGTGGNDLLNGGAGDDTLDGGGGTNVLVGGAGNDTFIVNNQATDLVSEGLNGGIDTVDASLNYTLGANIENLTLTGGALTGTGNALNNVLTGNGGINTLTGGAGHDTYIVQNETDSVVELLNAGIDLVQSSVTFTLGANVEQLTLTGADDINGTGNALHNILTGNSGANILTGGLGNDVYVVQNTTDSIVENANEGVDLVQSTAANFTLGANVEHLALLGSGDIDGAGNALNNILTGNEGENQLSGGDGDDVLNGGGEDDLLLGGAGNDQLLGGAGDDELDGGTGNDRMTGGLGDDEYVVDSAGDVITEGVNAGIDEVTASVSYVLGTNLEDLELTGVDGLSGIGNSLANRITGNSGTNTLLGLAGNDIMDGDVGNDILRGGSGNDTLIGGEGNDFLIGESGDDTFVFGEGDGADILRDNSGTADKLLFDFGIDPLDLVITREANNLRLTIGNSTDSVMIENWYLSTANRTETIQAGNGQVLLTAQVDQLIQAMAAFTTQTGLSWDAAAGGVGTAEQQAQFQGVLAANWQ